MSAANFKDYGVVHIKHEDQQRICLFARMQATLTETREELESQKKLYENVLEAIQQVEEASLLADDDAELTIPFELGDVFVHLNAEEAQESLSRRKTSLETEMASLETKADRLEQDVGRTRVELYKALGTNICLDLDD